MNLFRRFLVVCCVMFCAASALSQQTSPPTQEIPDPLKIEVPPPPPKTPAEILRSFHTIFVKTGTWLSKPEMLQGALLKYPDFDKWGLAFTTSSADVVLTIDHQPGWFYYVYNMTDSGSGVVVAAGRVNAWDGKDACNKVASEVIKRIRQFRSSESTETKK